MNVSKVIIKLGRLTAMWMRRSRTDRLGRIFPFLHVEIGARAFLAGLLRRVSKEEFGRRSVPQSSDISRRGCGCDGLVQKVATDAHVSAFDALPLVSIHVAVDRYLRASVARNHELMMD